MALDWSSLKCTWSVGPAFPESYVLGRNYRQADTPAKLGAEKSEWPQRVYDSLPQWAKGAADLRLQVWTITEAGYTGPNLYSFTTGGATYYCKPYQVPPAERDQAPAGGPPGGWVPWVIAGTAVLGLGVTLAMQRKRKRS